MALLGLTREYVWYGVPMVGFCIGWYLDRKETERMSLFRNKSSLYGRTLKEGEALPWP